MYVCMCVHKQGCVCVLCLYCTWLRTQYFLQVYLIVSQGFVCVCLCVCVCVLVGDIFTAQVVCALYGLMCVCVCVCECESLKTQNTTLKTLWLIYWWVLVCVQYTIRCVYACVYINRGVCVCVCVYCVCIVHG